MQHSARHAVFAVALAFAAACVAGSAPVQAAPPNGNKHGHGHDREQAHGNDRDHGRSHGSEAGGPPRAELRFGENDRVVVHGYFAGLAERGRCPPGLAKKHDGCLPPGQAKRWSIGRPLPRDVIFYSLPQELVVQLTPPPAGYRYVRVASDILMIAVGTGMVTAAIEDLGR
jgi:Ni/Co efflux regulator RcnB